MQVEDAVVLAHPAQVEAGERQRLAAERSGGRRRSATFHVDVVPSERKK
jgi:hypothetical protein